MTTPEDFPTGADLLKAEQRVTSDFVAFLYRHFGFKQMEEALHRWNTQGINELLEECPNKGDVPNTCTYCQNLSARQEKK